MEDGPELPPERRPVPWRGASLAIAACVLGVLASVVWEPRSSPDPLQATTIGETTIGTPAPITLPAATPPLDHAPVMEARVIKIPGTPSGSNLQTCVEELLDAAKRLQSARFDKGSSNEGELHMVKDGVRRLAMALEHVAGLLDRGSTPLTPEEWLVLIYVIWRATDELQWCGLLSEDSLLERARGIDMLARHARLRWTRAANSLAREEIGSLGKSLVPGLLSHAGGGNYDAHTSSLSQDEDLARMSLRDATSFASWTHFR
jgi:hypothetical protein